MLNVKTVSPAFRAGRHKRRFPLKCRASWGHRPTPPPGKQRNINGGRGTADRRILPYKYVPKKHREEKTYRPTRTKSENRSSEKVPCVSLHRLKNKKTATRETFSHLLDVNSRMPTHQTLHGDAGGGRGRGRHPSQRASAEVNSRRLNGGRGDQSARKRRQQSERAHTGRRGSSAGFLVTSGG